MSTTDLIRVVHYPDEPFDLGVVKRAYRPDGTRCGFVVLWCDGHADPIDYLGHLDETVSGDTYDPAHLRPVTVSRRREHCRRVFEWAEAAFAGWP